MLRVLLPMIHRSIQACLVLLLLQSELAIVILSEGGRGIQTHGAHAVRGLKLRLLSWLVLLLLLSVRGRLLRLREACRGLLSQSWGGEGALDLSARGNLLILNSSVRFSMMG